MRLMFVRGATALVVVIQMACSGLTDSSSRGAPCGRNQHASAAVTLPDSGINSGAEIQVSFVQHDPDLAGELSEVAVQRLWPASQSPDPEPDPRVRLLDGDGRVFFDTLGTRTSPGTAPRQTWYVLYWIKNAEVRNALYQAFANQTLWLELRRANTAAPATRLRLTTKEFGVSPAAICL